jgi:hypothetical protein
MTPFRTLVDQVYRTVLCRPADTDELSHHTHLLTSGKTDLASLINLAHKFPEYLMVVRPATEEVRQHIVSFLNESRLN